MVADWKRWNLTQISASDYGTDTTLTMSSPGADVLLPDAAESGLASLYRQRPHTVRLGMIASTDGKAAGPDGSSRTLNGPEDLRILRTLRAQADVVLVGAQTARRERYGAIAVPAAMADQRRNGGLGAQVQLAIVTRSGNLPLGLDPSSTWIITTAGSPASHRLDAKWEPRIIYAGSTQASPRTIVRELATRGMTRVLCEGGPTLANSLLERGLVEDYCLTTSPEPGGESAIQTPPVPDGFVLAHELIGGGFTMRRWRRK